MKILITGGAGFIGYAAAKLLKSQGHEAALLDLPDKFSDEQKQGFECKAVDIRSAENFAPLKGKTFDVIVHCAAQTSGAISQEQPELDVDTNVKGTLNVCHFARRCKARKIIFTSSMGVYGNYSQKIDEKVAPNPLSVYGMSKAGGEIIIKAFYQYGINHTIFRLFNVYGPGQNLSNMRQGMASIYLAQIIQGNTINVTGSFERYRDFVYIDDVVEALASALSALDSETINVGTGIKTTVRELINTLISISGKEPDKISIVNIGSHEGDQFGTCCDNSKLKSFGWSPRVSLQEGLRKMYQYGKEVLG